MQKMAISEAVSSCSEVLHSFVIINRNKVKHQQQRRVNQDTRGRIMCLLRYLHVFMFRRKLSYHHLVFEFVLWIISSSKQ